MKKGLAIFLICLSFFAGFFVNNTIEKLLNREISKEEWNEMTQDGDVEMIGGANGPTQIYTKSDK